MNRQAARKNTNDIGNTFNEESEKAIQNAHCFYPGCEDKPINSHIISKKLLRRIAENNHVLTWLPPYTFLSKMVDTIDEGESLEKLNRIPVLVHIEDTKRITDPLFCNPHDQKIFKQIENVEIATYYERIPKQVLLLAYRTLCSSTFRLTSMSPIDIILNAAKKVGYEHSLSEAERYARLSRFMAKDIMLSVYESYEQIRASKDYSQVGYGLYIMNMKPCIATTYSLIPVDDDDVKAILNGTLPLTPEDVINFTVLPHIPLINSICVISWLKGSQRASNFMLSNRINEIPEKEQKDLFIDFAFSSPTIYMSPKWWKSLSTEKQREYSMIHYETTKDHAKLI